MVRHNLEGRADQGDTFDWFEILVREFQAQGKEQQTDADLGQQFNVMNS